MTETTPDEPQLHHVANLLEAELEECHAAVMSVFRFAAEAGKADVQLNAMKAASRMMLSAAQAATALKRLRSPGTHHTVTVKEGRVPTPEKSKTNGQA
jgi:hypothetical protein